jgi:plastocyanin
MTKGVRILIAIVVVVIIAGAAVLLMPKNQSNQQTQSSENSQKDSTDSTTSNEADVTITYDGSSFSLSANSVKSGGTVKVMNTSSNKNLEFDSDPHPAHTNNSELNAGAIQPGKSVVFTLDKKGKWGFHNHLNSSQHGELTVE